MDTRYLRRLSDSVLEEMLREHPAIMVVGPRATGKTTTCERFAATSIRLGNDRRAAAVAADPASAIRNRDEPILIDEWQLVPSVLNEIKEEVDQHRRPGRFIVTGSVRGDVDSPTWPGTGRLVRLPMFGLSEREIEGRIDGPGWLDRVTDPLPSEITSDVDLRGYVERALRSGFPEPALRLSESGRHRWLGSYVDQLVTRDALDLESGRDPVRLRRFLEAIAINSAGIVNDVTLYESAGVTKATARAYERLLRNLLAIEAIPSWTSNRLKRLTLAPKRFLIDPGMFTGILGFGVNDVLEDGTVLGQVLETFVVAQLRVECALLPVPPRLYHLRTHEGRREIDLLIELSPNKMIAVEIKATSRPGPGDAVHLRWLIDELGDQVRAAVVLHTGGHTAELGRGIVALPIASLWS